MLYRFPKMPHCGLFGLKENSDYPHKSRFTHIVVSPYKEEGLGVVLSLDHLADRNKDIVAFYSKYLAVPVGMEYVEDEYV